MSKVVEKLSKQFEGKLTPEQVQALVGEYEEKVKAKVALIFDTIKLNSGGGERGIEMNEACQWVDATQNVLCTLFMMLKSTDQTPDAHLTKDFLFKVNANLQAIGNEGK